MRVHDSQAYRKMDMTWERISRILELREILLSIQTGFNLVNAAVVCAILETLSGSNSGTRGFTSTETIRLIRDGRAPLTSSDTQSRELSDSRAWNPRQL